MRLVSVEIRQRRVDANNVRGRQSRPSVGGAMLSFDFFSCQPPAPELQRTGAGLCGLIHLFAGLWLCTPY